MIWRPTVESEAAILTQLTKMTGRKLGLIVARFHKEVPISYWHALGYEESLRDRAEMPYCFLSWNAAVRRMLKMKEADVSYVPMEIYEILDKTEVRIVGWRLTDWWPDTQKELDRYKLMTTLFENSTLRQ